jgi:hypothetical protein
MSQAKALSNALPRSSASPNESALEDDDLPPLTGVFSSYSHRFSSVVRLVAEFSARNTGGETENTPPLELHHLPAYLSEQRARRPSAIRTDTVDTLATLVKESSVRDRGDAIGKDTAPPSPGVGVDAERGDFTYPPNSNSEAGATALSGLPRLSFTPASGEISPAQRKKQRIAEWSYLAAISWSFFLQGWNDGTVGPLLPVIQRDYGIGFAIAALLFVFNCVVCTGYTQ